MSHRPTVGPALYRAIVALDAALRAEFGQTGFSYRIVGLNRTLAEANTERTAGAPIKPKTKPASLKKGTHAPHQDAPQGRPLP
jgi:hypothetical protein